MGNGAQKTFLITLVILNEPRLPWDPFAKLLAFVPSVSGPPIITDRDDDSECYIQEEGKEEQSQHTGDKAVVIGVCHIQGQAARQRGGQPPPGKRRLEGHRQAKKRPIYRSFP